MEQLKQDVSELEALQEVHEQLVESNRELEMDLREELEMAHAATREVSINVYIMSKVKGKNSLIRIWYLHTLIERHADLPTHARLARMRKMRCGFYAV
jgi:regulator of replication initiation timing